MFASMRSLHVNVLLKIFSMFRCHTFHCSQRRARKGLEHVVFGPFSCLRLGRTATLDHSSSLQDIFRSALAKVDRVRESELKVNFATIYCKYADANDNALCVEHNCPSGRPSTCPNSHFNQP